MTLMLQIIDGKGDVSVFAGVVQASFGRVEGGAMIRLQCREPIKTALVPGRCEYEQTVSVDDDSVAALLNEHGRPVFSWGPNAARSSVGGPLR